MQDPGEHVPQNIAFVNELKVLYDRESMEVIDAAKTKPFRPGLSRARPRRPLHPNRPV